MWFLFILTFVNALANNNTFALRYRIEVGFPVSVFDALMGLGVIVGLLNRRGAFYSDRTHPLLYWTLGLFAAATIGGAIGGFTSGTELRWVLTAMRNLVTMPMCVLIGYCCLTDPKAASRYPYLQVWAGVGTALTVLIFFRSRAAESTTSDINLLRAVAYVTNYAGLAATLLLFAIIGRIQLLPLWLAVPLCGLCFLGQLAALSRSDWLATAAGVLAIYFLLPSFRPRGKLVAAMIGPPLIAVFIWIGLFVASAVTGRDFEKEMYNRVVSMLPSQQRAFRETKAWDTRLNAILLELSWWSDSPVIGNGFGIEELKARNLRRSEIEGLRHNTWTTTLAETGVIGFAAMASVVFGCIVIGRRLVRERLDRTSVLIGALGVITGSHFFFHGLSTMSFNQMRWAIPLGVIFGVVLRARAMQLQQIRLIQEQSYDEYPPEDEYTPDVPEQGWGAVA